MSAIRRKKPTLGYHTVSRITILKRLQEANKYVEAKAALNASDDFTQDLWAAAQHIKSNDQIVIALLQGIGADPSEILARE